MNNNNYIDDGEVQGIDDVGIWMGRGKKKKWGDGKEVGRVGDGRELEAECYK